jgi:hypothetical protein
MDPLELRDVVIERGIASLRASDHKPWQIEAGVYSFELCLNNQPTIERSRKL